jgi:hypothetical protein
MTDARPIDYMILASVFMVVVVVGDTISVDLLGSLGGFTSLSAWMAESSEGYNRSLWRMLGADYGEVEA